MSSITANLVEIFQWGAEIAGVLDLPTRHWPQPGQYLPCQYVQGGLELLPANLFRVLGGPDQLTVAPIPAFWQPGDPLVCAPPQGRGFNLPKYARRIGLIPYSVSPDRLLVLARAALDQRAAVALFYDVKPHDDTLERMPSQVEVLPLSSLQENLDWADYLAIDLVSLTGLDFTSESRVMFTSHSRPMFTSHDRSMFTTHRHPVFTTVA